MAEDRPSTLEEYLLAVAATRIIGITELKMKVPIRPFMRSRGEVMPAIQPPAIKAPVESAGAPKIRYVASPPANGAPNIISTNNLCKTFAIGSIEQQVLRDLDLEIRSGDFTVIMGQSGSGKSTLLYAISGMDTPSGGEIVFGDESISDKNSDQLALFRRKNCGFVFQQIYLCDFMTLMDNVMTSGLLLGGDRKEVAKKAKLLFHTVGLSRDDWQKYPAQVSGGEAQRAAIVRALINEPKILFADEPTGALNSSSSTAVLDLLTHANNNDQSIVMVTHDMTTALRGNRVLYLKDGVINGECNLGKYQQSSEVIVSRRETLRKFLQEKGW